MVLWLRWLSVIMNEWARNPLKCRRSAASGEGINFLFPIVVILSFLSIFGQPETHPRGLFLMWHCLNADMSYLSALDRVAARVKAQLLTCPPTHLGLLIWGSRAGRAEPARGSWAGRNSSALPPGEELPTHREAPRDCWDLANAAATWCS